MVLHGVLAKSDGYSLLLTAPEQDKRHLRTELEQPRESKPRIRVTLLIVLLWALSLILSGFVGMRMSTSKQTKCYQQQTTLANIPSEYQSTQFLTHSSSPFSGPPTSEVDSAWNELIHDKYMIIPSGDYDRNASNEVPLMGSNGRDYGPLATFEVFHALHCLNQLWKHTWPEYYRADRDRFDRDPATGHLHLDHCTDLLRQILQCNADHSVLTHHQKNGKIYADFNGVHQCQNFAAIESYTRTHAWSLNDMKLLDGYTDNDDLQFASLKENI